MSETITITASDRANALLASGAEFETKKTALIAELTAQRQSIDEALVTLGAKRRRKATEPKAKRAGRPAGSKNKPRTSPELIKALDTLMKDPVNAVQP